MLGVKMPGIKPGTFCNQVLYYSSTPTTSFETLLYQVWPVFSALTSSAAGFQKATGLHYHLPRKNNQLEIPGIEAGVFCMQKNPFTTTELWPSPKCIILLSVTLVSNSILNFAKWYLCSRV